MMDDGGRRSISHTLSLVIPYILTHPYIYLFHTPIMANDECTFKMHRLYIHKSLFHTNNLYTQNELRNRELEYRLFWQSFHE